jgi:hypothetical protein
MLRLPLTAISSGLVAPHSAVITSVAITAAIAFNKRLFPSAISSDVVLGNVMLIRSWCDLEV